MLDKNMLKVSHISQGFGKVKMGQKDQENRGSQGDKTPEQGIQNQSLLRTKSFAIAEV